MAARKTTSGFVTETLTAGRHRQPRYWVDLDGMGSGRSGGQEDGLYNNLDSPYLSKNAPLDTSMRHGRRGLAGRRNERFGCTTIHGKVRSTSTPPGRGDDCSRPMSPAPPDVECIRLSSKILSMWFASFNNGKDFADHSESWPDSHDHQPDRRFFEDPASPTDLWQHDRLYDVIIDYNIWQRVR